MDTFVIVVIIVAENEILNHHAVEIWLGQATTKRCGYRVITLHTLPHFAQPRACIDLAKTDDLRAPTMPSKAPAPSDFPSNLTVTITPPSASTPTPSPNILLLLHGLGDSAEAFTVFGRAMNLPETTVVAVQAPTPLPLDLGGFHWGDDIAFDTSTGGLDMDAGLTRSANILATVMRGALVQKCGYLLREITILGFGQGGMAGLAAARELGQKGSESSEETGSLAGVISIGAPYPLSGSRSGSKNRTPVLLVGGRDSIVVSDAAVRRTKEVFEFVEVSRYPRKGDGMPSNFEEMKPVMQFLARRLRSRQGVPEGSVEIG